MTNKIQTITMLRETRTCLKAFIRLPRTIQDAIKVRGAGKDKIRESLTEVREDEHTKQTIRREN